MTSSGLTSDSSAANPSTSALSQPQTSQPRSSLRSVSLLTSMTLLHLVLLFVTQLLLAKYFGASLEMDAYVAAAAPHMTLATILSGSLGYVLIPAVTAQLAAKNEQGAATIACQIGLYLFIVSLALTIIAAAAAGPLTTLFFPGFSAEQKTLATNLWRILSFIIVGNSLITYLNALFHCHGRFVRPGVASLLGTLVVPIYFLLFHERQGIYSIAWGTVAGTAVAIGILFPFFATQLKQSAVWMYPIHSGSRRCLSLLFPLLLASFYWRLDPLLDRYLGSFLSSGSIAHLGYAWRLVGGLMLIGTSGLSIVAFSAIAAHAAAAQKGALNAELAYAIRFFLFLIVPICVGLATFAHPVVRLMFERGKFTAADSEAVALLVVLYVGVILGAGLGDLLSRTFYSLHDTRTPVVVSTLVFTFTAALKFALVGRWAAPGLVLPTSIYYVLNSAVLAAVLLRRLSPGMLAGVPATAFRTVTSSAVACLTAYLILYWPNRLAVLPAAMGGAATYLFVMWLLADEFALKLLRGLIWNRGIGSTRLAHNQGGRERGE